MPPGEAENKYREQRSVWLSLYSNEYSPGSEWTPQRFDYPEVTPCAFELKDVGPVCHFGVANVGELPEPFTSCLARVICTRLEVKESNYDLAV